VAGLRDATADVARLPSNGALEHTDRLIYDVVVGGGTLRAEVGGTTDLVEWAISDDRPLMPFTARILGRPPASTGLDVDDDPGIPVVSPERVQRFGAYAVATDPVGRILLTRIAPRYPGAGRWHLPGGGTDHGETPQQGVARELVEETSQHGRITGLLSSSHRYDPAALGPEGVPMDWHVIRVLFRVRVDQPTEPEITEAAGGSTDAARWFTTDEAGRLGLTEITRTALDELSGEKVG